MSRDATFTTQNYFAHGGGELVIGGKLTVLEGATVTGLAGTSQLVAATENALGCVKAATKGSGDTVEAKIGSDGKMYVPTYPSTFTPVANQAASTASTVAALKEDFNTLLTALQTAGIMASE